MKELLTLPLSVTPELCRDCNFTLVDERFSKVRLCARLFSGAMLFLAGLLVLFIQGCASVDGNSGSRMPASSLTDTYWKLISLDGKAIMPEKNQREAHLILQDKSKRLAGSGGCNRIMGSYQLDGTSLSFGKIASTMMACVDVHDEQAFLATLEKIRRWKIEGARLDLLDENGQSRACFEAIARP